MDAFQALTNTPFGCGGQTDSDSDDANNAFYDADGEAMQVDHRRLQDGATYGDPGYRKASGKFVPVEELRGRRIAAEKR
ncbi:MAG: hypothetical protein A2845_04030 [Candidatus Lloydbacteria bacterium RIFCSPHIGHO2_01_FULL_49_22]|uniref:Uncharacterized protein n=1 Tax=Candidatus Lloydbacteria bacterium RIFCSPHIGHO2_01_FULL_49_22 TaxID=1798658 RepID=A0A1G2CXJ2_9BACT|nr:MAG: hypothetical protein A2845_04030 [Candidatus Lloydbacteria bacterium RIFCSPHIGHO2_01_FULL_49_22]OGZ09095.1 MAG: hypothetical protein A3C14_03865 [Candidatus Lloydbacteria bacterium RIFCSPHIGHO2_02_FULL_50_18]